MSSRSPEAGDSGIVWPFRVPGDDVPGPAIAPGTPCHEAPNSRRATDRGRSNLRGPELPSRGRGDVRPLPGLHADQGTGTRSGAEPGGPMPDSIRQENQKPGATDWQLTRVRPDRDGFRSPSIEGYCSRQSVSAGETIDIMVSTDPPRPFQIEIFRMGYYGGRGARLMTTLGPFEGKAQAVPTPGPKNLHECRWDADRPADHSPRLAQRRLPRPAHDPGRSRGRALLAELRRLHRPRRPAGRHPLPVLRQHLAGLQPLAEQLLDLHPPEGQPGPLGRRQLRPALRPRGPVRRRGQRPAHRRLGRVPAASSSRWPTGWSSTATT